MAAARVWRTRFAAGPLPVAGGRVRKPGRYTRAAAILSHPGCARGSGYEPGYGRGGAGRGSSQPALPLARRPAALRGAPAARGFALARSHLSARRWRQRYLGSPGSFGACDLVPHRGIDWAPWPKLSRLFSGRRHGGAARPAVARRVGCRVLPRTQRMVRRVEAAGRSRPRARKLEVSARRAFVLTNLYEDQSERLGVSTESQLAEQVSGCPILAQRGCGRLSFILASSVHRLLSVLRSCADTSEQDWGSSGARPLHALASTSHWNQRCGLW